MWLCKIPNSIGNINTYRWAITGPLNCFQLDIMPHATSILDTYNIYQVLAEQKQKFSAKEISLIARGIFNCSSMSRALSISFQVAYGSRGIANGKMLIECGKCETVD